MDMSEVLPAILVTAACGWLAVVLLGLAALEYAESKRTGSRVFVIPLVISILPTIAFAVGVVGLALQLKS